MPAVVHLALIFERAAFSLHADFFSFSLHMSFFCCTFAAKLAV
jgi:hypothetical protein